MAGINRAKIKYLDEASIIAKLISKRKPCIFISHISIDKSTAIKIGKYINNQADLDIYLDIYDKDLQAAVALNDIKKITAFIEEGLNESDFLLCLVSEKTINSWWVPYEIGFARRAKKRIATLTLSETVTLPEFLEIGDIIKGINSLNKYLKGIYMQSILSSKYKNLLIQKLIPHDEIHPLDDYLDWEH